MKRRSLKESLQYITKKSENLIRSKKSVSFKNLEIREYRRVLGDNPSCSAGPPMSIGWEHSLDDVIIAIDEYEEQNPYRRAPSELLLPRMVREKMLKEEGFTRKEMNSAAKHGLLHKNSRRKSVSRLHLDVMEERIEGALRKARKSLFPFKSKSQKDLLMWENASKGKITSCVMEEASCLVQY